MLKKVRKQQKQYQKLHLEKEKSKLKFFEFDQLKGDQYKDTLNKKSSSRNIIFESETLIKKINKMKEMENLFNQIQQNTEKSEDEADFFDKKELLSTY